MVYDLVIIGAGPAGSAAAIYAARKQLNTLLIATEFGGQSVVSDDIQNWIGTPHISGENLATSFKNHVKEYEGQWLTIALGEKVVNLEKTEDHFSIKTESGAVHSATTVLITAGSSRKKLEALGADRLEHKGLTYCASCDGPLFSDMDVAVIGGGNAAFESAAQLAAYCKSVRIIHRNKNFKADEITVEKIKSNPKITIITDAEVKEVQGESFVSGIKILHKDTGTEEDIPLSGVFVEIGQISNGSFSKNIVSVDELGKIIIDPWTQKTSCEGIWAAGDVTNIKYHQNNIAAGDGVRAIEDLYFWLKTKK